MKTDIKIYINTCDATMFFLPVFNYFFEKYWDIDQEVIILGYKVPEFPLPERYKYISMSDVQTGGVNSWSTYLKNYFESIDDDIIMWGIDDHLVVDSVNSDIISYFIKKMKEDASIGRVGLTRGISTREYTIVEKFKDWDVIELTQHESQNSPFAYRIDCNFGLWRREYLLKYLQSGWTPWQFEVDGSKLARNDGWKILSTFRKYGVLKVEGKRGISPGNVHLLGAKFEDILNLMELKLVDKNKIIGVSEWL